VAVAGESNGRPARLENTKGLVFAGGYQQDEVTTADPQAVVDGFGVFFYGILHRGLRYSTDGAALDD
jgi:hypothetical protein